MEVKNLRGYWVFGWNYQLLHIGYKGRYRVEQAVTQLKRFLEYCEDYNLNVVKDMSKEPVEKLIRKLKKKYKGKMKTILETTDSTEIEEVFSKITPTIESELKIPKVYSLSEKRFGLEKMLNNISAIFASGTFNKFDHFPRFDFTEAGKCIAFERPTAAAFHILRGTEGALRQYYIKKIRRKDQKQNPTWGDMISQLRSHKKTSKSMLDSLDNIRSNSRNPTFHPTLNYTIEEAEDLLSVCIDSVNKIMKTI